ncbi:MAG: CDGSH iron-sulfur domain-containing protein [Puniceicoccaceae bacterium]|nr:MAG: CDGSH iron-sulfur domain-containing protein [Puniceicoccaceae bacterium]
MSKPTIARKAPFVQKMAPGTYWWCACGRSANQPFCDGSHEGTEFSPVEVTIEEEKMVAWCACKHSGNGPFCDGTHSRL